ncbi:hypothetical protein [Chryseobacterium taeanense]|uniref:hypothetical protein n=1 Tax=Chryseobacterium taeanense TaxID=311334 RepID=UPI0035AEDE41
MVSFHQKVSCKGATGFLVLQKVCRKGATGVLVFWKASCRLQHVFWYPGKFPV